MGKLRNGENITSHRKGYISRINYEHIAASVLCFFFSQASLFTYMTPFGMAFFVSSFNVTGWYYSLIASVLGTIISRGDTSFMRYLLSLCVAASVLGLSDKRDRTFFKAITMSIIYLCISTVLLAMTDFVVYEFMLILFETFICFVSVYLMDGILPLSVNYSQRSFFSNRECIGLITVASIFVLSFAHTPPIFGIKVSSFFVAFLIMTVSLYSDITVSSMVGIIFGGVLSLCEYQSMSVVGAYAFSAFMASLFNRYSKLGVVLGFTLSNAIITAFFNDTWYVLINPIEVFFAGVILITLPQKVHAALETFFSKISGSGVCFKDGTMVMARKRLNTVSDAFDNIADIYRRECKTTHIGKSYITKLFDYAADNVCSGCGLKYGCWRNSGHNNYGYMLSMLEKIRKTGILTVMDLPAEFGARCVKKDEFVKVFNLVYEIYKTDKLWMEKMCETKELMANQLEGISCAIKNASMEMSRASDEKTQNFLRSELDRNGISCNDISVMRSGDDVCCVYIDPCDESSFEYLEKIEDIVSDSVERPMRFNDSICCENSKTMCFYPVEQYRLITAKAYLCKDGESVCGDSSEILFLPDGCGYVILSDGMGSGEKAYVQSRDTVDMLCSFLKAGFDFKSCVSLINASLILKNSKDSFSTLDILYVNLKNGEIDISKTGSASTYIKLGKNVQMIDSTSLPVGILRDIDVETTHLIADDEYTLVVMMSDGVSNTVLNNINNKDWIKDELEHINTKNPRLVANRILETAMRKSDGHAQDDMTVIVSLICKN